MKIVLYANDGFEVDIADSENGLKVFLNFRSPQGGVLSVCVDESEKQILAIVDKSGPGEPFRELLDHLTRD